METVSKQANRFLEPLDDQVIKKYDALQKVLEGCKLNN